MDVHDEIGVAVGVGRGGGGGTGGGAADGAEEDFAVGRRQSLDVGNHGLDLLAQEVRYPGPGGELVTVGFEIDPEIRRRLLEGLDDIGVSLGEDPRIAAFERDRERAGPVTTAL